MKQLKITKQLTRREAISLEKYFQEVSKIDLLSPDGEVELSKLIKQGDDYALNKLVRANLRFVISVSKQYQNHGLTLSDLISEGNIGLIKAAHRFDSTKGFKFISYAVWWIRQSILQALAEQARIVRLPLNKIGSINKINRAFAKLEQEFERVPTHEEIAKEVDIAPADIKRIMGSLGKHISMDAPISNDEPGNLYDIFINKDAKTPDNTLLKESLSKEIERILSTFSKRDAEIIRLYYGLEGKSPRTLEDIGLKLGLTRERVRQIKDRIIKSIKTRSKILKSYI